MSNVVVHFREGPPLEFEFDGDPSDDIITGLCDDDNQVLQFRNLESNLIVRSKQVNFIEVTDDV